MGAACSKHVVQVLRGRRGPHARYTTIDTSDAAAESVAAASRGSRTIPVANLNETDLDVEMVGGAAGDATHPVADPFNVEALSALAASSRAKPAGTQSRGQTFSQHQAERVRTALVRTDSLEDLMTCSICLDILYQPVTSPCSHSFCRVCVRRLIQYDTGGATCPTCRQPLRLDPDGLVVNRELLAKLEELFSEDVLGRKEEVDQVPAPPSCSAVCPVPPSRSAVCPVPPCCACGCLAPWRPPTAMSHDGRPRVVPSPNCPTSGSHDLFQPPHAGSTCLPPPPHTHPAQPRPTPAAAGGRGVRAGA